MFLVEKLAIDAWRLRRLHNVERAEIRLSTEFYGRDREAQQALEIRDVEAGLTGALSLVGKGGGLSALYQNPAALGRCLDLLSELKSEIETSGFDTERDIQLLAKLYGGALRNCKGLFPSYQEWSATSALSESERVHNGYATPRQYMEEFVSDLEKEKRRLEAMQAERASTECDRLRLEVTVRALPHPDRAELLLKYKSSIERDFERTLSQLERMQRQPRGQPQTPRIDVTIAKERS